MKCPICGHSYGVSHDCSGPAQPLPEELAPPPSGFVPIYYLREAVRIVRWDDVAIRRISRDPKALRYGVLILFLGFVLVSLFFALPQIRAGALPWAAYIVGSFIIFLLTLVLTLARYGTCHLFARLLFGASGSYMGVARPLLLGSIVEWLAIIPVVGPLIAGFWSLAILMFVFEEVDGIERLQAFGISFVVGPVFLGIQRYLLSPG